jgi:hypothetical protein
MADDFVKPRKALRHETLMSLRQKVKANDKFAIAKMGADEAVKLVSDNYGADEESARRFVEWIHGVPGDESKPSQASPIERTRKGCDPATGRETWLDPDEKVKAAEKPKKKR